MTAKSLILTILGGIAVALFAWWLNGDTYDLRYTLSEKIPLRFGGAQDETVQQMEVKNLSKKPVDRILVKLPPVLKEYEIYKNSQADAVQHYTNALSEEFVYPVLPPQGSFRIVFKTLGSGIYPSTVSVTHARGQATYALDATAKGSSISLLFNLAGLGFYCLSSLFFLRLGLIDSWQAKAKYHSEKLLNHSIPFYMPSEKWAALRAEAIQNVTMPQYVDTLSDVEESEPYKWLNRDKPGFLSEEELAISIRMSTKRLHSAFMDKLHWISSIEHVLKLLRVIKPKHYASDKWEELRTLLETEFQERRTRYLDERPAEKLQESKPDEISARTWSESQAAIANHWAASLYDEAVVHDSPVSYLQEHNLELLPKNRRERLLKNAYRAEMARFPSLASDDEAQAFLQKGKPHWMLDDDYERYKAVATRTLGVLKKQHFNQLMEYIASNTPLPQTDMDELEPDLREKLKVMDAQMRQARENNRSEAQRLSEESVQLGKDRRKVLRQLEIMNNMFSDPSSVDRVESYDNPFAAGNYEVLVKLSHILRAHKTGSPTP